MLSTATAVVLYVLGVMTDVVGIINVPGATTFTGGASPEAQLTSLGTMLFLVALVGWASVFWLRPHPLVAVIAGAVIALIGLSYVLLLIGAVAHVQRHPPRLRAVGTGVAAAVAAYAIREAATPWGAAMPWLFASRADAQYEPAWVVAPFIWGVISLAAAAAIVLTARARVTARQSDVRAEREHRRADALSEQMVRQAERERIARDMHDALAHRLSVVSLHAGALEAAASASASGSRHVASDAGEIARTVREQTHAALQDMRGLIGDLRSGTTVPPASPASMRAIGSLLGDLRAGGADVRPYIVIESAERAAAMLDTAVYRIVQESLTNIIKHAPGAPIEVFVQADPQSGVRIRIENALREAHGAGVPGGGNGMLGIRERASALGGEAWLGAHDGRFIVDVTLPWQERG
jgi:signal transduction histidine kinase